jgi:signal transduction histidine kinase
LVIRLLDKLVADVFASARLRITVLYFFTGAVILIIAGTIVYSQSIRILGEFTQGISFAVTENTALPPPAPPGATAGESMNLQDAAQNQRTSETLAGTLEQDIKRMIYAVAAGMSIAIFVSAYVLAGITLRPIRRVLENKKRFIGNVSHELRTPLSIMRMSSEAALLHEADVTKQELVATMRSNMDEVERMSRILKFLLTFSEFEHRAKDLPMSPVNLSRVIQNSTQLMDISLKKRS